MRYAIRLHVDDGHKTMARKALRIEREADAKAIAAALAALYPSYRYQVIMPKGARTYRLAVFCKASGAFLQYAQV